MSPLMQLTEFVILFGIVILIYTTGFFKTAIYFKNKKQERIEAFMEIIRTSRYSFFI